MENFLQNLKSSGAELEFVFKKTVSNDIEFLRRRLRDYHCGCEIIATIEKFEGDFKKLSQIYKFEEKFPYNTLILVALIQSAEKFGPVHGCNSHKGKPTVQQVALARSKDAAFLMGLDTFYFIQPGKWKVWCDSKVDMEKMTIQELDPNVVMAHFDLKPSQAPLFACLIGDLQSSHKYQSKVVNHFGKNLFMGAAKFLHKLKATTIEEQIEEIIGKIFGSKADSQIAEDFLDSIKTFEIDEEFETKVSPTILELVKNDFMSVAEEILLNTPIFINPALMPLVNSDMKSINDLVLPLIQKTTGILLKNSVDDEKRSLVLLMSNEGQFEHVPIEAITPDFDVPSLETLLSGEMSTMEKMEMLLWLTEVEVTDTHLIIIPEEYIADCVILLYLMKNQSLKLIDARCILKTIVDARNRAVPLEVSTEYPKKLNERAFRCSFLYSKLYFILHSCLSSLGMKNLCSEIQFDGVYFQKIYALNILEQDEVKEAAGDGVTDDQAGEFSPIEIIDEFDAIIRM